MSLIVRTSTAHVRPGRETEFRALTVAMVRQFPSQHFGLVRHEVLVSHDRRILTYRLEWIDEESIAAFAGSQRRSAPVTFDGEDEYLLRPLRIEHFEVVAF